MTAPEDYDLVVNGTEHHVAGAWIGESLLYVLRERLGLPGAKNACEQGECGSCSVLLDGVLVASCLVPAVVCGGAEVRTAPGLLGDDLSELPHLVSLSRWALRVMRQNLAFCLGILAAAIGFTFTGLLGPVSGALLGQLSAVAIIANSGRLAHR